MHATDAFKRDVPPMKLLMLDAWEEAPNFTDRERAALAWTEAVTLIAEGHVPDEVYNLARTQFSEQELVALTVCVAQINAWNRMAISMRAHPAGISTDKQIMK
jgi:alkylhydroperoxidase family enzyme